MAYTEEQKAYHRAYYQLRRQKIIDYLGGSCVECGSTDDLHFDHVDPESKSFSLSRNLTLESILTEVNKCQILCRAHHEAKTARENSGFTHGTVYGWMKKKCPCGDCQVAKWLWHDKRNEARRTTGRGPYKTRRMSV